MLIDPDDPDFDVNALPTLGALLSRRLFEDLPLWAPDVDLPPELRARRGAGARIRFIPDPLPPGVVAPLVIGRVDEVCERGGIFFASFWLRADALPNMDARVRLIPMFAFPSVLPFRPLYTAHGVRHRWAQTKVAERPKRIDLVEFRLELVTGAGL